MKSDRFTFENNNFQTNIEAAAALKKIKCHVCVFIRMLQGFEVAVENCNTVHQSVSASIRNRIWPWLFHFTENQVL